MLRQTSWLKHALSGLAQSTLLHRRLATVGTLALTLGLSASASDVKPAPPANDTPDAGILSEHVSRFKAGRQRFWNQIGKASWYGLSFQGKKTATGETFDMNNLTCAHRTLPLGSWIRVTNLRNRHSAFVRVNDRGPFIDDRIVDLSYAAARAVGIGGVGNVKLETVRPNDPELAKALLAQLQMPLPLLAVSR